MEKIVVTTREVRDVIVPPAGTSPEPAAQKPPLSLGLRLATLPLVLVLPVLCLVALAVRLALRSHSPKLRHAWAAWLNSLLIASGLLTTLLFSMAYFLAPRPMRFVSSLPALEYLPEFPKLPSAEPMSAQQVAQRTAPLVFVLSPDSGNWKLPDSYLETAAVGAGLLLHADKSGFLLATNRHVVDGESWLNPGGRPETILVFSKAGDYGQARVVARHRDLDLALVWMKRGAGESAFVQPIAPFSEAEAGRNVFVIGHPERYFFSLSTGIVMRTHEEKMVQISAPVSPGNSGGPVYEEHGKLLGVVSYKVDRRFNPNAENLNFAVRADALLDSGPWDFQANGKELMASWIKAHQAAFGPKSAGLSPADGGR
ncbi:MAG: trypsin-like peptidase domain-containing protein [Bryobacterales bacterium]|nr:trypsin-like peptidase domain-containing protein [Bryobacterales bacterium]